MEDAKYTALAAKYLSGEINSMERRELMEWVAASDANQAFFDEMIHIWGLTGDADKPFEANPTLAWNKVAGRINQANERKKEENVSRDAVLRPLSIKRRILQIAAVLLPIIAVMTWWLLQPEDPVQRLIVSDDKQIEVVLPDGSRVNLNTNSQLSYLEEFADRRVTLVGEAFFDVARDTTRPFEIYSEQTLTRVLGTSFNVRAYPEEDKVEVMVQTGRVEFREQADTEDRVILEADEAGVYKKSEKEVERTTSLGANANAWMKKRINLVDKPLSQVIQVINNYFRTDVMVENRESLDCNTSLPDLVDPDLEKALGIIAFQLFMEVDTVNNQIVLRGGDGCEK